MPQAGPKGGTIPMQPEPIECQVGTLNGVTAITRHWMPGQSKLCRLCEAGECTAARDVCTVQTTEDIREEDAPLYSSLDLDFGGDAIERTRPPLALAR